MIPNSIKEDRKAILSIDDNVKKLDLLLDLRKKILKGKTTELKDIYDFIPKEVIEEVKEEDDFIYKGEH